MGASGVLRLDHHGYFSKSKGKIGHILDMSEGGRMSAVTVDGPELYFFWKYTTPHEASLCPHG